jgi:hypothetical protein
MLNHSQTDLEAARSEISQLQMELDRARRLEVRAAPRWAWWTAWVGWLGLSAGVTMLVGAAALWAAMQSQERPRPWVAQPAVRCPPAPVCGVEPPSAPPASPNLDPPSISKRPPRNGHHLVSPHTPRPHPVCDGRDPLCGLDLGALDDAGKRPR